MPHEGQEIVNRRTGQRMRFARMREEELVIETVNPPSEDREPEHVHPEQESGAEVHAGVLTFEVRGHAREVGPGESISIPAGTPHRFWNQFSEDARSTQFFRPALDIASFFETYFELARRDALTDNGSVPLLQVAVMVPEFGREIRLTSPPWPVVRATSALLGPVAQMRGHRGRMAFGPQPG